MTVNTRIGKITADRETLNTISILFSMADEALQSKHNGKKDVYGARTSADEIYEALSEAGFYNR